MILTWITVFHHTLYETVPTELKEAISIQREAKKIRNNSSNAAFPLINRFRDGELSKEEFLSLSSDLEEKFLKYENEALVLFKEIKNIQAKHQTFGFDSYNIFSFQLSSRIVFFICIMLLILSIKIREKSKLLIRAFNIAAANFLIICAFYTTWVFYKGDDLYLSDYYTLMTVIAIGCGLITYFIINLIYKKLEERKTREQEFIQDAKHIREFFKQKMNRAKVTEI